MILVGAIPKGQYAELRVSLNTLQGRDIADIRVWFRPSDAADDADMIPSKKGVTFDVRSLPALAELVSTALALSEQTATLENGD